MNVFAIALLIAATVLLVSGLVAMLRVRGALRARLQMKQHVRGIDTEERDRIALGWRRIISASEKLNRKIDAIIQNRHHPTGERPSQGLLGSHLKPADQPYEGDAEAHAASDKPENVRAV
jgi:hypothetical protein